MGLIGHPVTRAGKPSTEGTTRCYCSSYHPWRRYFARNVDMAIGGILVGLVFLVTDSAPDRFDTPVSPLGYNVIFGLALFVVWTLVETLFLTLTGTTPGKWLFTIQVLTADWEKLSPLQALIRTILVYVQGLGFGIPLISLITAFFACHWLMISGTTRWDIAASAYVYHREWSVTRKVVVVIVTISVYLLTGFSFVLP